MIPAMFAASIDECYAPYAKSLEDDAPFGPASDPARWAHRTSVELRGASAMGMFADYSGGGYVVDLPINATRSSEIVASLAADDWINRATRAVFVDIAAYNANTRSLLSVPPPLHLVSSRPISRSPKANFPKLSFRISYGFTFYGMKGGAAGWSHTPTGTNQ